MIFHRLAWPHHPSPPRTSPPNAQAAIARANGIPPLVSLLNYTEGTEATIAHVVRALSLLASRDSDNQSQIAKRLVSQLAPDHSINTRMRSARALCNLASDQPSSRVLILNAGALMPLVKVSPCPLRHTFPSPPSHPHFSSYMSH